MSWYYAEGGRQIGPVDEDAFQALVESGAIHNQTWVWRAGMVQWQQFQSLRPAVSVLLPAAPRYGGFWIRFLAAIIDAVLLNVIGFAMFGILSAGSRTFGLDGVFVLIAIALAAAYEAWFIAEYGATPGKMICRLKVVMPGGGNVSFTRALGRHFAKYLSVFTLYIGFIMAGLDQQKRSLHDRLCDTRVVKT
jgi:uncharacterized RDD family membrane protein YckC